MDHATVLANIEHLLKVKKMSADAASKKAGTSDAIRNLRRRVRGQTNTSWTIDTLTAVARALDVEPWRLLKPPTVEENAADLRSLIRDEVEKALRPPTRKVRRTGS